MQNPRARPPNATRPPEGPRAAALLAAADHCVQCGLCLPHCATYAVSRDEGESPRGRIALIQGLLTGRLQAQPRLLAHLDHCLVCRACESVCPSRVPYGTIIDGIRAELEPRRGRSAAQRLLRRVTLDGIVTHRKALHFTVALLRLYQRSGLQIAARRSGLLDRLGLAGLEALLPALPPMRPWKSRYRAHGSSRGTVALFTGCVATVLDRVTLEAAIRVLNRIGFDVTVPAGQACCGALHRHNGASEGARSLARRNLRAFADPALTAVVGVASGCTAELSEYAQLLSDEDDTAFPQRVWDITRFVADTPWPASVTPAPLAARALVHDPCTLTNVLRVPDAPYRLLERIPGLKVDPLPGNAHCCGAAGSQLLTDRAQAQRLLEPKLVALRAARPQFLITSNVGCALHFAGALGHGLNDLELLHPVALLDRQLTAGAQRDGDELPGATHSGVME
ncbi:MAG: (Fe-S)-binding protein [Gammaproteobacteria bacterium]